MVQKSYDGSPTIYIVPTPIGNLEDITLRALKILKQVDVIFAEDTRTTGNLLRHFEIKNKLLPCHLYNESKMITKALEYLKLKKNIAIVSDAGTPIISDPGYILVSQAIKEGYNVVCLPGPTAIIPAVVTSGLAGGPFMFYGFLNSKESKKRKELEKLKEYKYPLVFYEAPHRIKETLKEISTILGNRKIAIIREISKKYEEVIRDNIENIINNKLDIKGEIVIVIDGNKEQKKYENLTIKEHIKLYITDNITPKEAIKIVAKERHIPKSEVYSEYLKMKNNR